MLTPRTRTRRRTRSHAGAVLSAVLAVGLLPWGTNAQAAPPPTAGAASAAQDRSAGTSQGRWQVTPVGPGQWRVTWTSPGQVPRASYDPEIVVRGASFRVGPVRIGPERRSMSAVVTGPSTPRVGALDVRQGGRSLDATLRPLAPRGDGGWTPPERTPLAVDPTADADGPIVTWDYQRAPAEVDGLPRVEMAGHVVEPAPAAASPANPVVVFLHGRHDACYDAVARKFTVTWPCEGAARPVPSALGYDYIQRLLARQGFVTVSIAANGINQQDDRTVDGGMTARSELVRRHLDLLAAWDDSGRLQADLDRVVLVGHSRGGEGVARASAEIALDAPYRVVGQVLLAPTDFSRQTSPYVPTVALLPSCDGDVSGLDGQVFVDEARDTVDDDTALKSAVMMIGGNHNFLNTEWTPGISSTPSQDDAVGRGPCAMGAPTRLSAAQERQAGKAYVAGAVRLLARGESDFLPMFDGTATEVASAGPAVMLSAALGGGRDTRAPGLDTVSVIEQNAEARLCVGSSGPAPDTSCGDELDPDSTPHWPFHANREPRRPALELRWQAPGGVGGLVLAEPLDLSDAASLELRTIVRPDDAAADGGAVKVKVRVSDGSGTTVTVDPVGGVDRAPLPHGAFTEKLWAQTLRVDPAALTGLDLADITEVSLLGRSDRGHVYVLDLSAVPADLAPVPERRLPQLDVGTPEVARTGPGTYDVVTPYTVSSALDSPALLRLVLADPDSGGVVTSADLEIPAGPTSGELTVALPLDFRDVRGRARVQVRAYGLDGVVARAWVRQTSFRDTRDLPRISVEPVRSRIVEGEPARFRVSVFPARQYSLFGSISAVRGDRALQPARVGDLGQAWVRRFVQPRADALPLTRVSFGVTTRIALGEDSAIVTVPTRRDPRTEPDRTLALRFIFERGVQARPVSSVRLSDR